MRKCGQWLVSCVQALLDLLVAILLVLTCFMALLFYVKKEDTTRVLYEWVEASASLLGQEPSEVLDKRVERFKDLVTDQVNLSANARWQTNTATIYIASQEPLFQEAYQAAITNWNATGVFSFQLVDDPSQAQIIATDMDDGTTQAAGEASTTTDGLTHYFTDVVVRLNRYYLLDPAYGYELDRIIHTAEHELGHAIGLAHEDSQPSVMESAGSYHGIQEADIEAVRALYAD